MTVVGQNIPHDSARGHVTGESIFIDDMPPARGEVLVDFLGSPIAHGRVRGLDLSAAAQVSGSVGLFTWRDIPGSNKFGPIVHDEHLLADKIVLYVGDPLVLIAGETREAIAEAKRLIHLDIEPL